MLAKEIIKRVREIQVRTGRQVADVLAGEYVSVFKGRGLEFDEVRPYIPGDDVRSIDWNVTARTGEPFVKRYQEERQLTLMLMADVSASQEFGSGGKSKRDAAAELCALLAFSANLNDDKVGLTLFHGDIEQYIPPRKGQKHSLRVVREVLTHGLDTPESKKRIPVTKRNRKSKPSLFKWGKSLRKANQSTDIEGAVEFMMQVCKRKTVCFVVSDFFDEQYENALRSANRKHDVIAVLVTDEREEIIPNVGMIALEDAESGKRGLYNTGSKAFRQKVERNSQERIEELRSKFAGSGIDFIHIEANKSIVDPLVKFFKKRERRRR